MRISNNEWFQLYTSVERKIIINTHTERSLQKCSAPLSDCLPNTCWVMSFNLSTSLGWFRPSISVNDADMIHAQMRGHIRSCFHLTTKGCKQHQCVNYWLSLWINTVPYNSEHVFLHESYLKCYSAAKPQRTFHHKHPQFQFHAQHPSINFLLKSVLLIGYSEEVPN